MAGKRLRRRAPRGSSLLTAMGLSIVLLFMVVAVIYMTGRMRTRAVRPLRDLAREGCAQAGLNLARIYFANNFASWGTYLSTPGQYNPVAATWMMGAPAD